MTGWVIGIVAFLAASGLLAYLFSRWLQRLNLRLQTLSSRIALLEHVPFVRPPLPVDNVADAGVSVPADQDDVEAWAQEQELYGKPVTKEEIVLQRRMRMAEGL